MLAAPPDGPPVQRPGQREPVPPKPEAEAAPSLPADPPQPEPKPTPQADPSPPAEATPAPRTEPAPPPSTDALPSYDSAPSPTAIGRQPEDQAGDGEPQLREVPPDGIGMLTLGSLVASAGIGLLAAGITTAGDGNTEITTFGPLLVAGVIAPLAGTVLIGSGATRHGKYRRWKAEQHDPIPHQGNGLMGAGGVLLVGGTIAGVIGGVVWWDSTFGFFPTGRPPEAPALVGLGISSAALGATLLALGARRNKRFTAWRRETSGRSGAALGPLVGPLPGGAQFGVTGRF